MAFEKNTAYEKRIEFKNGGNATVFEFPKANYFAGMDLDFNLDITIATAAMVGILARQISRMVEKLQIYRDGDNVVWEVAGEDLARMFQYRDGVESAGNGQISVGTGANKTGRMFLHVPFYPLDAPKPSDYAMDTNSHKYELKIKFRDITAANSLFKDLNGGSITVNTSGSYIDLTLHKITPVKGPNGNMDNYKAKPPYFIGLMATTHTIAATKPDFDIELPENKVLRKAVLFANSDAADGLDPTGSSSIFSDALHLKNTQGRTIQNIKASTLRELTALKRRNASLEAGLYDYDFTEFGNIVDSLVSDGLAPLKIVAAVAKQTYDTRVQSIVETVEQQGGA